MRTKAEVLADTRLMQEACNKWVYRNIGTCVSSLMYDVGQNLEACSEIFDFDFDEAMGWFVRDGWKESVNYLIDNADLDDLESIADSTSGSWAGVLAESGVPEVKEIEDDGTLMWKVGEEFFDADYEAEEAALLSVIDTLREKVKELVTDHEEVAREHGLDPVQDEVYEHWTIPEGWTARDLREQGEVVFDFGGMRIWGRMTTGQAISMDGTIQRIVKDLDENHWIWSDI